MEFNRFSTNFPHMDKPSGWFLLAKCIFKHFASKNQLPGLLRNWNIGR